MKFFLQRLGADRRGATSIEYAVIASLISVAIAVTVGEIAPLVQDNYVKVEAAFPQ